MSKSSKGINIEGAPAHSIKFTTLSILVFYLRMEIPFYNCYDGFSISNQNENPNISDKKQITYILTKNGISIPVHLKFFRVYMVLGSVPPWLDCDIIVSLGNRNDL